MQTTLYINIPFILSWAKSREQHNWEGDWGAVHFTKYEVQKTLLKKNFFQCGNTKSFLCSFSLPFCVCYVFISPPFFLLSVFLSRLAFVVEAVVEVYWNAKTNVEEMKEGGGDGGHRRMKREKKILLRGGGESCPFFTSDSEKWQTLFFFWYACNCSRQTAAEHEPKRMQREKTFTRDILRNGIFHFFVFFLYLYYFF